MDSLFFVLGIVCLKMAMTQLSACPESCFCMDSFVTCSDFKFLDLALLPPSTDTLVLTNGDVEEIPPGFLATATNLKMLELMAVNVRIVRGSAFRGLQHMDLLSITSCSFDIVEPDGFSGLTEVGKLHISDSTFGRLGKHAFAYINNVLDLKIWSSKFETIADEAFYQLSDVTSFQFYHNNITTLGSNVFLGASRLEDVTITMNRVQTLSKGSFESIAKGANRMMLNANTFVCSCDLAWLLDVAVLEEFLGYNFCSFPGKSNTGTGTFILSEISRDALCSSASSTPVLVSATENSQDRAISERHDSTTDSSQDGALSEKHESITDSRQDGALSERHESTTNTSQDGALSERHESTTDSGRDGALSEHHESTTDISQDSGLSDQHNDFSIVEEVFDFNFLEAEAVHTDTTSKLSTESSSHALTTMPLRASSSSSSSSSSLPHLSSSSLPSSSFLSLLMSTSPPPPPPKPSSVFSFSHSSSPSFSLTLLLNSSVMSTPSSIPQTPSVSTSPTTQPADPLLPLSMNGHISSYASSDSEILSSASSDSDIASTSSSVSKILPSALSNSEAPSSFSSNNEMSSSLPSNSVPSSSFSLNGKISSSSLASGEFSSAVLSNNESSSFTTTEDAKVVLRSQSSSVPSFAILSHPDSLLQSDSIEKESTLLTSKSPSRSFGLYKSTEWPRDEEIIDDTEHTINTHDSIAVNDYKLVPKDEAIKDTQNEISANIITDNPGTSNMGAQTNSTAPTNVDLTVTNKHEHAIAYTEAAFASELADSSSQNGAQSPLSLCFNMLLFGVCVALVGNYCF